MVQFSTPKDFLAVAVGLIEKGRPREREREMGGVVIEVFFLRRKLQPCEVEPNESSLYKRGAVENSNHVTHA